MYSEVKYNGMWIIPFILGSILEQYVIGFIVQAIIVLQTICKYCFFILVQNPRFLYCNNQNKIRGSICINSKLHDTYPTRYKSSRL